MTKKCNNCKLTKDVSMFYKDKSSKAGIRGICKSCDDITTELWRAKNKDQYLSRQRKRWENNEDKKISNKIISQKHRDEMSDMYIK